MLNYGTMRFQTHHMNSVVVETWEAFIVSAGNIISDSFSKTRLLLLSTPNMITNTQACVASIQTSPKCINHISEDTIEPIKLITTSTNNPMVIIRVKGSIQQPSRNILLRAVAYDTVQKRTVPPLMDMKR